MLVVSVRVEDSHEEAMRTARNGHDEFWKFLGPYGWSRGYMGEDGRPVKPGLIPSLEESMKQRTILLGTAEQVAEQVQDFKDLLGLEYLTIFPHLIGDSYAKAEEQMARFMDEVVPLVR
jgi:alkanesulfonate monooxygenase SsuD/methylene tetrahydromethanopterin reductase-like flavin-dependent oxidoreductase (luciferase family)